MTGIWYIWPKNRYYVVSWWSFRFSLLAVMKTTQQTVSLVTSSRWTLTKTCKSAHIDNCTCQCEQIYCNFHLFFLTCVLSEVMLFTKLKLKLKATVFLHQCMNVDERLSLALHCCLCVCVCECVCKWVKADLCCKVLWVVAKTRKGLYKYSSINC